MVLTRVQFSGPNRNYQIALRALCHWNSVGLPSYQLWGTQGSILGPLLFFSHVNDLQKCELSSEYIGTLFAYDPTTPKEN